MKYKFNIPKGTIIECYNCGERIAEFVKEVKKGQLTNYKDLKSIDGDNLSLRSSMVCLNCGKHYIRTDGFKSITEIHTTEGWLE